MENSEKIVVWDPDSTSFPTRRNLPAIPGAPAEAAWFWGQDDNLGRINLLTPARVRRAAAEIKTGDVIPLDLPLDVPEVPAFDRAPFKHDIKPLFPGVCYDDQYGLNTQSGSQWDGFRHLAHIASKTFYNGVRGTDIEGRSANHKGGIHHWAQHGLTGRGLLLDYWSYAKSQNISYDVYTSHAISYSDLVACGKCQEIDIRPAAAGGDVEIGDIVLIRSAFVDAYHQLSPERRNALAERPGSLDVSKNQQCYAGLKQEEAMLDWLHDCYFAAVGGDAHTLERWPSDQKYWLHEYILALWGMPLGEMLDLERLSAQCRQSGRWWFFFTSAVNNCPGGVASHVNGSAIF